MEEAQEPALMNISSFPNGPKHHRRLGKVLHRAA